MKTYVALAINVLTGRSSFDEFLNRHARYKDTPIGARASRDMAVLHEQRRSNSKEVMGRGHRYLIKEDVDYISELHKHIEIKWDGTLYDFKDKDVQLIKIAFDKQWLKEKKKIPYEYTDECAKNKEAIRVMLL